MKHAAFGLVLLAPVMVGTACSTSKDSSGFADPQGDAGQVFGGGDGGLGGDGAVSPTSSDPVTCAQAAASKSYIGCDYWPTVIGNSVWSIFDFAVVVANAASTAADVTVTGPSGTNQKVTVQPQQLATIYLPWVSELKGQDFDDRTSPQPLTSSVFSAKGAYHLVSSSPVTVYQFSPLEYKGQGGASGKSWSACPGGPSNPYGVPCYSFSNDASLLLPSTAMTGNYRVTGIHGWTEDAEIIPGIKQSQDAMGAYFAITGTADGTNVKVRVSGNGKVVAGGPITATDANGILSLTLNAGDVAEVMGSLGEKYDLSGSQVTADKPVQVLAGISCINLPKGAGTCDHIEESVLPAETLGKHYVVTVPTGPNGTPVEHVVRIYGNVDGTKLTYAGAASPCPSTVDAGQVLDCGVVKNDFEVTGDHEFAVGSFMVGSSIVDPGAGQTAKGDPSESQMIAVEQYRTKYIFLAPADYDVSYVDVVAPSGTKLTLDGQGVTASATPVGSSNLTVTRVKLGPGQQGAHVMTGDKAFGIQVMGYGAATSYQYPGGLDLHAIAPPPPPVR